MLIAAGNMRNVQQALSVGEIVDYDGASALNAEIVAGTEPGWYIIETFANHERIAAAHMVGRRFGVFVPEKEETVVRRGRKIATTRLLFTGYVFVFVWDIERHFRRLTAIPGVMRVICRSGGGQPVPVKISDKMIDDIRAVENKHRPLPPILAESGVIGIKKKRRWRKSRQKPQDDANAIDPTIVAVRPWSAFQDALITLDEQGRNQTLHRALGLAL